MRKRELARRRNFRVMLRVLKDRSDDEHHGQDGRESHKRILCGDDGKLVDRSDKDNFRMVNSPGINDPG